MDINSLRKYRINLENFPEILNAKNDGIALFDLSATLVAAAIIDKSTNLYFTKQFGIKYYLSTILLGIIVHHITAHILSPGKLFPPEITYLNKKLFSLEVNIYKVLLLISIGYLLKKI